MSPVAAPSDRRFRRAHVKPSGRRRRWRSLVKPVGRYVLVGLAAAFVLYRVSLAAVHAHVLQIDRVDVHGNGRLSKDEILELLSGIHGESLIWTNLDPWRRRLLASPWVADVVLRRSLPSTIDVTVLERQPMSVARLEGELYLVDERGVRIDRYGSKYADVDLPIVDGLEGASTSEGRTIDQDRADLASRVVTALRAKPEIARQVSQIDVDDVHNVAVILTGDRAVIHLGEERFLQRLQSYLTLASALRERVSDIEYVDLRFDDRIFVRPTGQPATAVRR